MTSDGDPVASPAARQYLRLHLADWVGPIRVANLLQRFGSVEAVLSASKTALERVERVGPATAEAIVRARSDGAADEQLARAGDLGIRILCLEDPEYPKALARIPDPPICLYVRGRLCPQDDAAIAIVGTRRCSRYGGEQARRFGSLLAGAGFTVVSGLARGVDGQAHEGAMEAGGRTIAVLGNGLPEIYPPEHEALAERIIEHGAVISEMPLGTAPDIGNFPRRNRVIAGLCAGVLVVEAPKQSGALSTARYATEYDREVLALPGRVDTALAFGTNRLIRDGARLVTCLEDILEEVQAVERVAVPASERSAAGEPVGPVEPTLFDPSPDERRVLEALGEDELALETLREACDIPVHRIMTALMNLQLKGRVRQLPGSRFLRRDAAPGV